MIPLSLYIHLPWCEKKCPYCDFNSHQPKAGEVSADEQRRYLNALTEDLRQDLQAWQSDIGERKISSIFIGGGTPSLFSADAIGELLQLTHDSLTIDEKAEITLEANPGSAELSKFAGFRSAGINRLSIGTQSFNNKHLTALGRIHRADEGVRAAHAARDAGFDNVNLDVMFALPNQSTAQAIQDVQQALALNPSHLSCYQLTIEPNTLFHARPPKVPDDESTWEMQEAINATLIAAGFEHYEVSAWSLPQRHCRHNLNYWQFGDYLGIGAGAHSKITANNGRISRAWKFKHPQSYMLKAEAGDSVCGARNPVAEAQVPFEFMLNALRLQDGFALALFTERTGLPVSEILPTLQKHESASLVRLQNDYVALTSRGKLMVDSMLQDYLADGS